MYAAVKKNYKHIVDQEDEIDWHTKRPENWKNKIGSSFLRNYALAIINPLTGSHNIHPAHLVIVPSTTNISIADFPWLVYNECLELHACDLHCW